MTGTILGLDINDIGTSAAIVADGTLRAAAQQERFNRSKQTRVYPGDAVRFCLESVGATLRDVDYVSLSVNPAIYLEQLNTVQTERARYRAELLYAPLSYLIGGAGRLAGDETQLRVAMADGHPLELRFVRHHDCHAAAAFFLSPFESAVICSIDGFGEKDSMAIFLGQGTKIERVATVMFPHSLGGVYAAMVEFLGLRPFRDEWMLMAAAAHGDPKRYAKTFEALVRPHGPLSFEVALEYFNYHQFHTPGLFTELLSEQLGPPYARGDVPDQRFFDIAAATQATLEATALRIINNLAREYPTRNICLTGGVAYNCVLNGKVAIETPYERVFVPPAPDDCGTSVGSALAVLHRIAPAHRHPPAVHNYLGPQFTEAEIESVLKRARLRYERCPNPAEFAARRLADGALVGWFQGAIEFGDRALGNRSVLADPRSPDTHGRLASALKTRAAYQPFAPSVLAELAHQYFEDVQPSPWMDKVFRCKRSAVERIPAAVSGDGTARIQTVTREQNALFASLIEHFRRLTGVPMVVNTSFNHHGEPLVCSPEDAIRTFYTSTLDTLCIGPFVVHK